MSKKQLRGCKQWIYLFLKDMLSYRLSFIDRFCFMFLCLIFVLIFVSRSCHFYGVPPEALGIWPCSWGPWDAVGDRKRRKKRRSEDRGLTEAHNGDHFDHYVLTKDRQLWRFDSLTFLFIYFFVCKTIKTVLKTTFWNQNCHQIFIQELTKRRSRGWTWAWKVGSTDRLTVFFSVSLSICAVCGCEFISGGPSLVGFDPVTVLKNYYGQQLSGDLKIWFTIHNMIWFMYIMYISYFV